VQNYKIPDELPYFSATIYRQTTIIGRQAGITECRPFLPVMRQLCQGSADMLQNTPLCRNNCERKTQNFLESIKIRHNFASEIRNDIAL
jgi:hypothetical protein